MCKQNYIVIKYENVNTKGIKQGYETRLYLAKNKTKHMKQDCTLHYY